MFAFANKDSGMGALKTKEKKNKLEMKKVTILILK